ncbi:hypothetical protein SUGI_0658340 [Cryptomeria japonica]|uniref:probable proteasome inhibitor n=1 Tax=Cryptomeria japonica TaxID=3369 RepID=UPI002414A36B|nr:probable proteasome inhibitor [Cryptomeria japonica]GLJ32723.1 hypothetical protein SUGI_0658340 [Cryptomeria japonica]
MADSVLAVIRASRPSFRNAHDRVAFAVHASFLSAGYSLTATGTEAAAASAPSSPGHEEVGIEGWNEMEDAYAFCYSKSDKGENKSVIVKCLVMGDMLIVDAALISAKENSEPCNLEINVNEYINDSTTSSNYSEQYKDFPTLVDRINSAIISKLEDSPKKESAANSSRSTATSSGQEANESQPVLGRPVYQPDSSGLVYPPVPSFGGSDLFPGPGAGIYPRRSGGGMGGGMLLGPNDPGWGNIGGMGGDEGLGFPGEVRGVPPGARFDPYGPPGVPGFEPNRFARDQRRPGGRGNHPDLEHFSPF